MMDGIKIKIMPSLVATTYASARTTFVLTHSTQTYNDYLGSDLGWTFQAGKSPGHPVQSAKVKSVAASFDFSSMVL